MRETRQTRNRATDATCRAADSEVTTRDRRDRALRPVVCRVVPLAWDPGMSCFCGMPMNRAIHTPVETGPSPDRRHAGGAERDASLYSTIFEMTTEPNEVAA